MSTPKLWITNMNKQINSRKITKTSLPRSSPVYPIGSRKPSFREAMVWGKVSLRESLEYEK